MFLNRLHSHSQAEFTFLIQKLMISYSYRFGKGPYYVKFVINQMTIETPQLFFVIEIPSRKVLPHSIYTFLTLVESKLYNDGAAFLSARDGGFQIGSNADSMALEQKLKPLVRFYYVSFVISLSIFFVSFIDYLVLRIASQHYFF